MNENNMANLNDPILLDRAIRDGFFTASVTWGTIEEIVKNAIDKGIVSKEDLQRLAVEMPHRYGQWAV
jgi:hypothetical protein